MNAPAEAPVQPEVTNPMTFRELKAIRLQFLGFFLALGGVVVCFSGFARMVFDPTGDPIRANIPPLVILTSIVVPILLYAGLIAFYSRRVGMPRWWLAVIVSVVPVINLIAFYIVVGFTPDHLKPEQDSEENRGAPFPYWVLPGLLPMIVMGSLASINPSYMAQLVHGPPIGTNIPGLPIPFGWPILALILFFIMLGDFIVWLAARMRWVRGGWMSFLTVQIIATIELPAVWLVMLGPAAVQVFKQFVVDQ